MSSISLDNEPVHDPRIDDANHPIWMSSFNYALRHDLVDQDLEAGRTVSRILLTIISGGLALGLVGVIASLMTL